MNGYDEVNIKFVKSIRNKLKDTIAGRPRQSTLLKPKGTGFLGGLWASLKKNYYDALKEAQSRIDKYKKFAFLDKNLAEATSVLNIYADNIVSGAIGGEENFKVVIDEQTPNGDAIAEIVEKLEQRTGIKDDVWELARDMMESGDRFAEVVVAQLDGGNVGIRKLKKLPENELYADVDDRGVFNDPNFPYYQRPSVYARKKIPFDWWRIIHFKTGSAVYGVDRSLFANASLRIGRQLLWIDDSIVLARLSRACQRYAYMVDTSGIPPQDKLDYVKQWLTDLKTEEVIDAVTGEIDVLDTPPLPDKDIAIPVEKDSPQDVRVLSGDANLGNIDDVKYMETKFFMAVGMPKAYASQEEGTRAKATLTQLDVQFARQVRRRQRALNPGLRQFYETEFILNNIDPNSFEWNIVFPALGTMDELMKWEMEAIKAQVAKTLVVDIGVVNELWILEVLMGFNQEQMKKYAQVLPVELGGNEDKETANINFTPEMRVLIKRDPQLRAMLSNMKDLVNWQLSREQELEDKKSVGIARTKPVGDNWK